jgi:predicted metal-dependent peptidase
MLMLNNLTEEQRLSKAVVKIMGHAPYLSAVLMIGKRQITDDPKTTTAYTNGKDEFYSRQFVAKLNDAELRFLVLHEVYHKLYKHLTTWRHLSQTVQAPDHVETSLEGRPTTCQCSLRSRD